MKLILFFKFRELQFHEIFEEKENFRDLKNSVNTQYKKEYWLNTSFNIPLRFCANSFPFGTIYCLHWNTI